MYMAMAELAEDFGSFRTLATLMGLDPSFDLIDDFSTAIENPSFHLRSFSDNSFSLPQPLQQLSAPHAESMPWCPPAECPYPVPGVALLGVSVIGKEEIISSDGGAVPPSNDDGGEVETETKTGPRRGKRRHSCGEEKPAGVVHVRAKRGQATDRHSLAERSLGLCTMQVRREKINEKMRRLQTLVPGCYKAMGTTVMLDEIINYVRSLQNQVEFLSMKLSAAAALCDFTLSEADLAAAVMPKLRPSVGHHADYQVQEMDGLMIREYEGLGGIEAAIPF
ncbi:unnamed protein product [Spirodela intermedia]|uniref:BHLH domain-containing protein n=1 Tax=Spirodela intermedia TaxID=51605 RepID=A0A7I8LME4_SPIIN|nr:unnamed protein product [Spirodela intermedia]